MGYRSVMVSLALDGPNDACLAVAGDLAERFDARVVGIAAASSGLGYWLASDDGHVYAFGVPQKGDLAGSHRSKIVAIAAAPGEGYWLISADGALHPFSAPFSLRSLASKSKTDVVAVLPAKR